MSTTRRTATCGLLATGAAAMSACSRGPIDGNRSPGTKNDAAPAMAPEVPASPFGPRSTAEEVSAGVDLAGRVALVTGATSGLGLETMRVLALRGATVLATGRTRDKAAEACASVAPAAVPIAMDLADWDSIVAAAEEVRRTAPKLDIVVCNAGIMAVPRLEHVRGIERHFAVNHLGHFLLVHHLLDRVTAAPQGRVVVLSSAMYRAAPPEGIRFDDLSGRRQYDPDQAYGQSKLANALFAFELARRLRNTPATANAVHPGVINTGLDRERPALRRLGSRALAWRRPWMKSVEEGAATQVYVASAPALAGVTGHWFEDCQSVVPPGDHIRNDALAARLWEVSGHLLESHLG